MEQKLEKIFTVSEYIEAVNIALSRFKVKVVGEVTEAKPDKNGHIWFSIKDKAESVLNCVCWKYNYQISGVHLEEGIEVVLSGSADIYKKSGKFTFKAETISLRGKGALKKAYEELKKKLEKEGLFAEERKKPLPQYPQKIGIITSKQGAALGDFLTNLGQFGFKIRFIDSRVEGAEAVKDLLSAIKQMESQDIEAVVLTRGGGSLESLQAFHNEMVVKATAEFAKPVIAAIGHERDVPLLALSADLAVSTPTAAARALSRSWEEAQLKIEQQERKVLDRFSEALNRQNKQLSQLFLFLTAKLNAIFKRYHQLEYGLKNNLYTIHQAIAKQKDYLSQCIQKITSRLAEELVVIKKELVFIEKTVKANSPKKLLSLGYSIARRNGKVLRSINKVKLGDDFDLMLKDGIIKNKVLSTKALNSD